jgi:uncharacterized membrane protein YraQ (UPF0718 family)
MTVITTILDIALTAAPWLLLGLVAAGLVKAFIPDSVLQRWVGGRGFAGISRAAVIGAPLPLCSCGAIPTAVALHRGGAGRGPTTAFLIGTPGVGVDSMAITYALLGPFMMIARVAGAVTTAITTGLLVASAGRTPAHETAAAPRRKAACGDDACCGGGEEATPDDTCCGSGSTNDGRTRLAGGMRYAFNELYDDISGWMLVGIVLAGVLTALVPPGTLASIGTGPLPILIMAVIGIPLYICATAATPVAAGLLLTGVSPGAVITFLLAGPVTSLATLGVLRREMGTGVLGVYLLGIVVSTVAIGLLVDQLLTGTGFDVLGQIENASGLMPPGVGAVSLAVLTVLGVRPWRRFVMRVLGG